MFNLIIPGSFSEKVISGLKPGQKYKVEAEALFTQMEKEILIQRKSTSHEFYNN